MGPLHHSPESTVQYQYSTAVRARGEESPVRTECPHTWGQIERALTRPPVTSVTCSVSTRSLSQTHIYILYIGCTVPGFATRPRARRARGAQARDTAYAGMSQSECREARKGVLIHSTTRNNLPIYGPGYNCHCQLNHSITCTVIMNECRNVSLSLIHAHSFNARSHGGAGTSPRSRGYDAADSSLDERRCRARSSAASRAKGTAGAASA